MRTQRERVLVKAPAGMLCRRPAREGGGIVDDKQPALVPLTTYWLRRIQAGDVVRCEGVAPAAPTEDAAPVETVAPRAATEEPKHETPRRHRGSKSEEE